MIFIGTHYAHKHGVLYSGFQKHFSRNQFRDGKPAKRDKSMLCNATWLYNFNGDGSGPCVIDRKLINNYATFGVLDAPHLLYH